MLKKINVLMAFLWFIDNNIEIHTYIYINKSIVINYFSKTYNNEYSNYSWGWNNCILKYKAFVYFRIIINISNIQRIFVFPFELEKIIQNIKSFIKLINNFKVL